MDSVVQLQEMNGNVGLEVGSKAFILINLDSCGGLAAIASCTNGGCQQGFTCTPSNYCCECPVGRSSGRCNQGTCPSGFTCQANGYCCSSCPDNATPYGSCRNGTCGGGATCRAGNICCL